MTMTSTRSIAFPSIARTDVFMIGTKRLWLRWPCLPDAARLARIGGDPLVSRRIATWPEGASEAYAAERIERMRAANADGSSLAFAIVRAGGWNDAIGLAGIAIGEDGDGKLGYHLAPSAWGQGYATEAVTALVAMTRLLVRMPAIRASVMPDNPGSARVLVKAGFVPVGSGEITTTFRGRIAVDHYERRILPAVGRTAAEDAAA
jgi:RimJ/RimL family protein N-acetyltransferase